MRVAEVEIEETDGRVIGGDGIIGARGAPAPRGMEEVPGWSGTGHRGGEIKGSQLKGKHWRKKVGESG